jgi:6-phosphogluconate dehydrogenase
VNTVVTPADLAARLTDTPRIIWIMVPAGPITEGVLQSVAAVAAPGDVIIEGGNSNYKDSKRHAQEMAAKGLSFLDCGTSGGVWGWRTATA